MLVPYFLLLPPQHTIQSLCDCSFLQVDFTSCLVSQKTVDTSLEVYGLLCSICGHCCVWKASHSVDILMRKACFTPHKKQVLISVNVLTVFILSDLIRLVTKFSMLNALQTRCKFCSFYSVKLPESRKFNQQFDFI